MTPTSVGMRCPECAGEKTKVRTVPRRSPSNPYGARSFSWSDPSTWSVTGTLIWINILAFLAEVATGFPLGGGNGSNSTVFWHGVLFGQALTGHNPFGPPANGTHEYWRLLTSGFLHAGILHIGMNMLSLWFVGRVLEPAIGKGYFAAIYFTALLAGSFGAILFLPGAPTLGASGAIFGIFGALIVIAHARGLPLWQSGLLPILVLNFVYTLTVADVSVGGHLLGVLAGFLTGWLVVHYGERRGRSGVVYGACLAISVLAVIGAVALAGGQGLTPNGLRL